MCRDQHLVQLSLPSYQMQCNLDGTQLAQFSRLQRLDLSGNAIFGRQAACTVWQTPVAAVMADTRLPSAAACAAVAGATSSRQAPH